MQQTSDYNYPHVLSQMNCPTIDLNRAERAVSSLFNDVQDEYRQRQLNSKRHPRYNYLPLYPAIACSPNDRLLLTNVPGLYFLIDTSMMNTLTSSFVFFCHSLVTRLPLLEIIRRQHGAYTEDALMFMNNYRFAKTGFRLLKEDAEELAARLRVGMSIITFNAERLSGISHFFCQLHETFRLKILRVPCIRLKEPTLNSKQMALALEFYLQIDSEYF